MTDVFEVAKPKTTNALGGQIEPKTRPAPKVRQPPKQDIVAAADVLPVKKTRRKRAARADPLDEHMLFMRLYNELWALPKAARSRLLASLTRQLA